MWKKKNIIRDTLQKIILIFFFFLSFFISFDLPNCFLRNILEEINTLLENESSTRCVNHCQIHLRRGGAKMGFYPLGILAFCPRFQPFAPIRRNIWHYAPVSKLYRGVPLFQFSMTLKLSYLRYSIITKPSYMQVLAILAIQRGFWPIKYSRIIVCNSAMGKPSY